MIKTVIFDFGGVLIEWNPRFLYGPFFRTPEDTEAFLSEIDFDGWNMQQDKGRPFAQGVQALVSCFPQHERLIRLYHERWIESIGQPIEASVEILRKLRASGYRVYGLSNWSTETFPLVRARYDFFNLLDGYILSGEVRLVKPEPEIFQLLLMRLGCRAQECLFIDDSAQNVEVARQLGFACVRFHSPSQLENELVKMGILKEAIA